MSVILNEAKRSEESLYRLEALRFFAALRMTTSFSTEHQTLLNSVRLRHLRYELILSGAYDKDSGPLLYLLEPNTLGFNSLLA